MPMMPCRMAVPAMMSATRGLARHFRLGIGGYLWLSRGWRGLDRRGAETGKQAQGSRKDQKIQNAFHWLFSDSLQNPCGPI